MKKTTAYQIVLNFGQLKYILGSNKKNIFKKDLRSSSKMDEIPKNWTWAQNKLPNTFVQNLMKGVKGKVREFGQEKIKR